MATVDGITVKLGDCISFKSDFEQTGKVTKVQGEYIHLHNPNGFGGDYLRGATDTVEHARNCWRE